MIRRSFLQITFVVATVAFSVSEVCADDKQPNRSVISGSVTAPAPSGPPKDWREETEATCGMTCRYHRANDNLTLQALYLVTKIQKIEAIKDKNPDSAKIALGLFCKTKDEDIATCFNRYKDFQRVALLEIRQAIGKNEDTIAKLTTGRKADGTVEGTALAYSTGADGVPYMPDVPTLAELEASYLQGNLKPAGKPYSKEEIQAWSQSLVVNDPRTRYLEFNTTPVVGNPYQEEKSSYSLYTEKNDGARRNQGDARAAAQYQKSAKAIQAFGDPKDKSFDPSSIKAVAVTKKLKTDDLVSYEAFTQARSIINSKIDTDVKQRDKDELDRKVASDKDPKSKPSPAPSGAPSPVPNTNSGVSRDVKVTPGTSASRAPTGNFKTYGDDEKVERPPEMKNSRYIKYDLGDMLHDIEGIDSSSK